MEKGYKKLKVFNEAHELILMVYKATEKFPRSEMFGLTGQMRRAAVSVAANVIEGQARFSKKEFRRFLFLANGSLVELEYYLELTLALDYISNAQYEELEKRRLVVGALLGGLIRSIKT